MPLTANARAPRALPAQSKDALASFAVASGSVQSTSSGCAAFLWSGESTKYSGPVCFRGSAGVRPEGLSSPASRGTFAASSAVSSSSESSSMYAVTSRKSVVPSQDPSSSLWAFALTVQSSIILKVLPVAKYFPQVILSFLSGTFNPGPLATLNGVNKARLADLCTRVQRPSFPSLPHESTWRSSGLLFSGLGILQLSKCNRLSSATFLASLLFERSWML